MASPQTFSIQPAGAQMAAPLVIESAEPEDDGVNVFFHRHCPRTAQA